MKIKLEQNDPEVATIFHYDEAADVTTVERVQDVKTILKDNRALYNETDGYMSSAREMKRVASIPLVVVEDLMKRKIWGDAKKLKAWLNDPENRFFRTSAGWV